MGSPLRDLEQMFAARLPEMEERFRTLPSRYASHAGVAEALVAAWEWSALPRYELEPFYFELGDCRRGRAMRGEPPKIAGRHQYGLTASGDLVLERQHVESSGQFYEKFLMAEGSEIKSELYSYNPAKTPINSARLLYASEECLCFQSWATHGYSQHVYKREDGRITSFLTRFHPFRRSPFGGEYVVEYVSESEVRIVATAPGARRIAYSGKLIADPAIERTATGRPVVAAHLDR